MIDKKLKTFIGTTCPHQENQKLSVVDILSTTDNYSRKRR